MRDRIAEALKDHATQYVEIRLEQSEGTHLRYRGRNLEEVGRTTGISGTVRALARGGSCFNDLSRLKEKVATAISFVQSLHQEAEDLAHRAVQLLAAPQVKGGEYTVVLDPVLAGDFNANVLLGFRVSHGKIVGRVKNTTVSGNVYQVLNNLAAIGDRARWVRERIRTPALYCQGVSVSAKKQGYETP